MERVKGVRDFLPKDMILRESIFSTLKRVFESFGFDPLETPAIETWELLSAKGGLGEEAVKDIFRLRDKAGRELGLRFDLTVPLARVVASNPQLPKPFKRYQISRVWRYEEIRKGRYREFWQADIDTIGVRSMRADAEILAVVVKCLEELGFDDFYIKLNNRKVLDGLTEDLSIARRSRFAVFRAIDKLEKLGAERVKEELEKLIEKQAVEGVFKFITLKGSNEEMLARAEQMLRSEVGKQGVRELEELLSIAGIYGIEGRLRIDFSLARGLDYYTGPIFEAVIGGAERLGSVAGGGRYDKLVEIYGGPPTPATGISFGVERLAELLRERVELRATKTKLFVASATEEVRQDVLRLAQKLRKDGLAVETDLMGRKLRKQLEYADSAGIPYVVIVGREELGRGVVRLRDMRKRVEKEVEVERIPLSID
jgi:histidyl-tRNA synthetase